MLPYLASMLRQTQSDILIDEYINTRLRQTKTIHKKRNKTKKEKKTTTELL